MAEISNKVRTQLLNGDVSTLTKNGRLSCVTTKTTHSDDSRRKSTEIDCKDRSLKPTQKKLGLFYTYVHRSYDTHSHSRTSLKWFGVVKVRGQEYRVAVEDNNLNGKIEFFGRFAGDVIDLAANETLPGDIVSISLPIRDHQQGPDGNSPFSPVQQHMLNRQIKENSAPPVPKAEIIKAIEVQYQSALEAAGLLVIKRAPRAPLHVPR